ncbi:hypothetical protein [Bailinhaonella thermotolerans]|uniref:Uncharacterized protein n=1 Tax=Bailinhaonella thermotolerans TaxID=1070861 RepID=A0A3A3ZY61_9ACTN|nr:hypothetical protein [Bailinhaonella thermotolerans]RJL19727.1 hypothetical protein D5H75_40080 [Bailinhaonella thermotolerans]
MRMVVCPTQDRLTPWSVVDFTVTPPEARMSRRVWRTLHAARAYAELATARPHAYAAAAEAAHLLDTICDRYARWIEEVGAPRLIPGADGSYLIEWIAGPDAWARLALWGGVDVTATAYLGSTVQVGPYLRSTATARVEMLTGYVIRITPVTAPAAELAAA